MTSAFFHLQYHDWGETLEQGTEPPTAPWAPQQKRWPGCVFTTHCCVCVHLDGLNAEHIFRVWDTIFGHTVFHDSSRHRQMYCIKQSTLFLTPRYCRTSSTLSSFLNASDSFMQTAWQTWSAFPKSIVSLSKSFEKSIPEHYLGHLSVIQLVDEVYMDTSSWQDLLAVFH